MADKSKGYVLLYRSICDDPLWKIKPFDPARAWVDLFLTSNHAEGKVYTGSGFNRVGRGQKWTSVRALAERWGWSRGKVTRYLCALERDGKIHKNGTPDGTMITVVNYEDLQTRRDTKRDTNGTQTDDQTGHRRGQNKEERKEGKKELERSAPAPVYQEPENPETIQDDIEWIDANDIILQI